MHFTCSLFDCVTESKNKRWLRRLDDNWPLIKFHFRTSSGSTRERRRRNFHWGNLFDFWNFKSSCINKTYKFRFAIFVFEQAIIYHECFWSCGHWYWPFMTFAFNLKNATACRPSRFYCCEGRSYLKNYYSLMIL